jgi:hypothetical protein
VTPEDEQLLRQYEDLEATITSANKRAIQLQLFHWAFAWPEHVVKRLAARSIGADGKMKRITETRP